MSFVNISRESSSKLTVEFPSHKSQHDICQGPVTVVTFGHTLSIDATVQPVRVDLPRNRSVIEIYDSEKKLVCSWETTSPTAAEGVRTVAPKLEDTDSDDCVILFSRKTKRPNLFRFPLTRESSTATSSRTSEIPHPPSSPAKQHILKRPASITPRESPSSATLRPQAGLVAQTPDSTPAESISDHQSHPTTSHPTTPRPTTLYPTSRARRTLGIKVPRPRATRQAQPSARKSPRSGDSTRAPHATIHQKETQSAATRRQPKKAKTVSSRPPHPPLFHVPNPNLPLTQYQTRFLSKVIKEISKDLHAAEFLHPVDPIDNPTYPSLITTPIDLGAISEKLKSAQYHTLGSLSADVDLMVQNAETFNGPENEITQDAIFLQNRFKEHLAHFPGPEIDNMEAVNLLFALGLEGNDSQEVAAAMGERPLRGAKRKAIDYSIENYFNKKLRLV